ncbi:MAG: DUF4320 family protein [Oscillospiraceae bacterium]|nr:DUF4320 family protein [Oscillospiraceae bacterium]
MDNLGRKHGVKNFLLTRRGEGYIDVIVTVLAAMMLLVLALNTFSFIALQLNMDHFTKKLLAEATAEGRLSVNITNRQEELRLEAGLPAMTVRWDAVYFNPTQKTVQLGEKMELTVTCLTAFKGIGLFNIPITITTRHTGLSQRYWK